MEIMTPKENKKFDVALINSCIVYWYLGDDETYMSRIESYEEWLPKYPSRKKEYDAMLIVKKFINIQELAASAFNQYATEVKTQEFPSVEQSYHMDDEILKEIR